MLSAAAVAPNVSKIFIRLTARPCGPIVRQPLTHADWPPREDYFPSHLSRGSIELGRGSAESDMRSRFNSHDVAPPFVAGPAKVCRERIPFLVGAKKIK